MPGKSHPFRDVDPLSAACTCTHKTFPLFPNAYRLKENHTPSALKRGNQVRMWFCPEQSPPSGYYPAQAIAISSSVGSPRKRKLTLTFKIAQTVSIRRCHQGISFKRWKRPRQFLIYCGRDFQSRFKSSAQSLS